MHPFRFGSNTLLFNHIRSVHMEMYIRICDKCGKKSRCREDFERHMLTHKGVPASTVTCDICGTKVAYERALRQHKLIKHPEGGKVEYKCHLCPRVSDNLLSHKRHVKYKHELSSNFKCSLCPKEFKTRPKLKVSGCVESTMNVTKYI